MLHLAELRPPKEDACRGGRAAAHSLIELKELPRKHSNKPWWLTTCWAFISNFLHTCSHTKPVCHVAKNEKKTWERLHPDAHASEMNNQSRPWWQNCDYRWQSAEKKDYSRWFPAQPHTSSAFVESLFHFHWNGLVISSRMYMRSGNHRCKKFTSSSKFMFTSDLQEDTLVPRPPAGIPPWSSEDGCYIHVTLVSRFNGLGSWPLDHRVWVNGTCTMEVRVHSTWATLWTSDIRCLDNSSTVCAMVFLALLAGRKWALPELYIE